MSPEPEAPAFPEPESSPRGHAPFRETLADWAGSAGRGGRGPGVPRPEAVTSAWGWVYLAEGSLGMRGYPAKFRPGVVLP